MTVSTESLTTLEKLKPATSLGGLVAEVARVTRFYEVDDEANSVQEFGTPIIEVLWGKTVAATIAELEAKQEAVALTAAADIAKLEKAATDLSKAEAAVDPLELLDDINI